MNTNSKYLIVIIVIGLIVAIFSQWSAFVEPVVSDDVRAFFFMHKANDHELFQNDLLTAYVENPASTRATQPVMWLFIFLSKFFDLIMISKILPFIILIFTLLYAYKFGKLLKNKTTGFILGILFSIHVWTMLLLDGATPRSFAFLLLFAFMYYFIKKDYIKSCITLVLSAWIYPLIFVIGVLTYCISFINFRAKKLELTKEKIIPIILAVVIGLLLMPSTLWNIENLGETYTLTEIVQMPEYYAKGRLPVFRGDIPFYESGIKEIARTFTNSYNLSMPIIYLATPLLTLFILFLILRRKAALRLPKELWSMVLASILLHILAWIFLIKLYLPSRYIQTTAIVFLLAVVSKNMDYYISKIKKHKHKIMTLAVIVIVLFVWYVPFIKDNLTLCENQDLYDFISTLPKDAVIAGHPKTMDCIPLYSKRIAFIMSELNLPINKDYYEEVKQRNYDLFTAYYASNLVQIKKFCKENHVSHIVVDKYHFSDQYLNRSTLYHPPFNEHIKAITQNRNFVLNTTRVKYSTVFEDDSVYVIAC